MKKDLVLGYSNWNAPSNGIGPFTSIFSKSRILNSYTDFEFVDAIVLWGGEDISPSLYGQEPILKSGPKTPSIRDVYEWELLRLASNNSLPIIGICRGAQILCAFAGGTLIQDVTGHNTGHDISTYDGKLLYSNAHHHQMMSPDNTHHELLAWNTRLSAYYYPSDTFGASQLAKELIKEPEVVYFPKVNGIGIQSHPEWNIKDSTFNNWLNETILAHFPTLRNKK